jgi:hypothetical protein
MQVERYCTLGKNKSGCEPGSHCARCGWDSAEAERRRKLIKAERFKMLKGGLKALNVGGTDNDR